MSKIVLNDIDNPENQTSTVNTVNANNAVIETAFDNTLSRDGTQPNQMGSALDMNSNQIYNLPAPSSTSSPARLIDVVSNPTIVIPGTGTSGHVVPFLDQTNTWSGNQYFKNGQPWADVKAWGATGNGSVSDDTTIQNAINYMYTTYGGGVVYLPPGNYLITTGITIKGTVRVIGAGEYTTYLNGFATNVNTVTFDSSCTRGCGLENINVQGYANVAATTNAIVVSQNVPAVMTNVIGWYGSAGLFTQGIDGCHTNCWFIGSVNGIVSSGANWYNRCIVDSNGSFSSYQSGFIQGVKYGGATSQENHFVMCDFSGPFTNSVAIHGSNVATPFTISVFEGCIMSAPIDILGAYWTSLIGCELAGNVVLNGSTGGNCSVVGCAAIGTTLTLTGSFAKAGNINIT